MKDKLVVEKLGPNSSHKCSKNGCKHKAQYNIYLRIKDKVTRYNLCNACIVNVLTIAAKEFSDEQK